MNLPNRYEVAHFLSESAVDAAAGYVGAWFAAGPKSGLADPVAGAIMAVAARITFALVDKHVFAWAEEQNDGFITKALTTTAIISLVGGLAVTRCCGYPVGLDDITVFFIGLIVGAPVALIGYIAIVPLVGRCIQLIEGSAN